MLSKLSARLGAGRWRATCRHLAAAGLMVAPTATLALDLTAGSGAARECSSPVPNLHVEAIAYLEPAPLSSIDEYGGRHYSAARGSNAGVGIGFAELAAAAGPYCIGLVYREEGQGLATKDLIDMLHGDHYDRPFESEHDYQ